MGVTPGGIHQETSLVLADSLRKCFRALLNQDVSPALLAWYSGVDLVSSIIMERGKDDLSLELGLANLSLNAAAVDGNVTKIGQQLLSSVLTADEVKETWGIINEGGPASTLNESRVGEQRCQERDVGLDTTDTEFDQGSEHLSSGNLIGRAMAGTLHQHGIIVRGDDGTGKTVSTVQTDTVTTGRSVDFDLSGIGLEVLGGILRGNTALDSKSTGGDAVLGEAELLQGGTGGNLDLGSDNIDAGDFLGDSVLDLDTGVDFNEVISVLLIHQELCGSCVSVVDGLGQSDGIPQDGISDILGEILGWGNLDDLLVSTLHGAVTLVQMDQVSVVISQELDLNVLGLVEESLDEDCSVSESGLCLGCGSVEGVFQRRLIADDSHATTATSICGLDDDGEAILVGELLDFFKLGYSAFGTRDDWHISLNGNSSGRDLVTKGIDDVGRWADKLLTAAVD